MKKLFFLLLLSGIAFNIQAQNKNTIAGMPVLPDTAKTKIPFENFWEISFAYGKGLNAEFIPQTENVWATNMVVRASMQHPKYLLGFGYDAQVIALRNTESGTNMYNEVKHFGNPQHTFYGFADKIKRLKKVDVYVGVLAGFCMGKADAIDSTTQFMQYESSKGYVIGGHIGAVYKVKTKWSAFIEFEPKMYGINFDYKNKNGSDKSVDFRIKTFPILLGVKYAFK